MNNSIPPFVFFGTPSVAKETLEYLSEHGIVPTFIVTNPDAVRGRGQTLKQSEVKEWALANNIPVETPSKLNSDAIKKITDYKCDFAVVVAYGKIFPEELITKFPHGVLNIHFSLLPKYRGASPVETALKNGDSITGVSIQKMVREVDAGAVLSECAVSIKPSDTTCELRARLVKKGSEMLSDILPSFINGSLIEKKQNEKDITYTSKIKKEDGLLSLSGDAVKNWNTYRAYFESPGTFFFAIRNNKRIRVKIVRATYTNNTFIINRVIPEGKNEQSFEELVRAGWVVE